MQIKNSELQSTLTKFESLKGYPLDGDITLALIQLKKKLNSSVSVTEEAIKSTKESFALKNEDGSPNILIKTADDGKQYYFYQFESPAKELECQKQLDIINDGLTIIDDMSIAKERLLTLKLTEEQMESLLLLTNQQ